MLLMICEILHATPKEVGERMSDEEFIFFSESIIEKIRRENEQVKRIGKRSNIGKRLPRKK